MAKVHSKYVCQQCGYETTGWLGKCPNCNSWGSLIETLTQNSKFESQNSKSQIQKPIALSDVAVKSTKRISVKISELDRVLGGGLVPGQVILLAGEPGIGKSTLLLQLANNFPNTLYVSGEESAAQIKVRAQRLGVRNKNIKVLESVDIDQVINGIGEGELVIVDSIQTMSTGDLAGMAGSVGQVRECAFRLVRMAKSLGVPIFIVGHVTKEGSVAGPAVLAHIVDSVLWFEGDKELSLRILRANKNRFGPTDEVGIFEMQDKGLVGIDDPGKLFIGQQSLNAPGSVLASILQGTRPILVEVQGLTVPTKMAFPRRTAQGIDAKKFELILAVLAKRANLPVYDYDCFVNLAGGIVVREPSIDLAVALSIAGSYFDKSLPSKTIAIGEVGLLGDIRPVMGQARREKEARRLGYRNIVSATSFGNIRQVIEKYFR